MRLLRVLLVLPALALAPSIALAADAKPAPEKSAKDSKAPDKKAKAGEDKPKDDGLFASQDNLVPLPTVIAPVLYNDRLIAHLYIYVAVLTKDASDAQAVKMRLPYIQDALVRDVNDSTLTVSEPNADPDTKPLIAHFKAVINNAVGKPLVTDLQVGRVDMAPY